MDFKMLSDVYVIERSRVHYTYIMSANSEDPGKYIIMMYVLYGRGDWTSTMNVTTRLAYKKNAALS